MNMKENQLPFEVVKRFAESILQGNAIYHQLSIDRKLPHIYLNIPEAMLTTAHITGTHIEEWVSLQFYLKKLCKTQIVKFVILEFVRLPTRFGGVSVTCTTQRLS